MEYALPREHAAEAVRAAREILERHPVIFPIELRFMAADDALLSPAHGRDRAYVAVHVFEGMDCEAPFREVEAVMAGSAGARTGASARSWRARRELAAALPGGWDAFQAAATRELATAGRARSTANVRLGAPRYRRRTEPRQETAA